MQAQYTTISLAGERRQTDKNYGWFSQFDAGIPDEVIVLTNDPRWHAGMAEESSHKNIGFFWRDSYTAGRPWRSHCFVDAARMPPKLIATQPLPMFPHLTAFIAMPNSAKYTSYLDDCEPDYSNCVGLMGHLGTKWSDWEELLPIDVRARLYTFLRELEIFVPLHFPQEVVTRITYDDGWILDNIPPTRITSAALAKLINLPENLAHTNASTMVQFNALLQLLARYE